MKTEIRNISILITVIAVASFAVLPTVIGLEAGSIAASTYVNGNCDLTLSTGSIDFGYLNAGTTSDPETVNMKDNAQASNLESIVSLSGDDWGTGFPVTSTIYTFPGGSPTSLTATSTVIGTVPQNPAGENVGFTVSVPANQAAGNYSQTITVTFECSVPV